MWRIILKRWYYKRLEKFMIKVNTIFVMSKQPTITFAFDLKASP